MKRGLHSWLAGTSLVMLAASAGHAREQITLWRLDFEAACAAGERYCLGQHGFSVDSHGVYAVGSAREEAPARGRLLGDSLRRLHDLVLQIPASSGQAGCEPPGGTPSESVSLHRFGITHKLWNSGCGDAPQEGPAREIYLEVRKLVETYYPQVHSDDCLTTTEKINQLVSKLGACTVDFDCRYFDTRYEPVERGTDAFVLTDDCSRIVPLAVGGSGLVHLNRPKLLALEAEAQEACGPKLMRPGCAQVQGFRTEGRNPVCREGRCRPHFESPR